MQRFILTIFGILLFTGLVWALLFMYGQTKKYPTKTLPFFTDNFEVIAHRGGALEAPENTLTAFDYVTTLSKKMIIELDVHWSKDQQIVVFHDPLLDRTTNESGQLKEKTLAELKKLDAAYHFKNEQGEYPQRGRGIQIPTLAEVFDRFPNTRIIVEIKPNSADLTKAVLELVKKYNRFENTVVGSAHGELMKYIRTLDENVITAASKDENLRTAMLGNMKLQSLDNMPGDVFCIPEKYSNVQVLTANLLSEAKKRNKKVFVWTVNELEEMKRLISQDVNGIITDRPKALESLVNTLHSSE